MTSLPVLALPVQALPVARLYQWRCFTIGDALPTFKAHYLFVNTHRRRHY